MDVHIVTFLANSANHIKSYLEPLSFCLYAIVPTPLPAALRL
jgi:hypothetical protein